MTCSALMTKDPLTARESETVGAASEKLIAHHYINLPVVDGAGKFLGMFGIYDLLSLLVPRVALAGGQLPNVRFISDDPRDLRTRYREIRSRLIGEVADREAVVVHPDTPEIEALRLFCRHHTTLAVVERGSRKLVGIMSYWDAIRALTQEP
jgi:CBS domain-containing protein